MMVFVFSTFHTGLKNLIGSFLRSSAAVLLFATSALAQDSPSSTSVGTQGGVSAIWIFANLSFTGMRAQAKGSLLWKVIAFIFGFPATLLTLLVVTPGSERAYGIDMPRRRTPQ